MRAALQSYFDRIGYDGPIAPTLETLRALQEAHVVAVPFENLSVLRSETMRLSLAALEHKLVDQRRGGYCFEHNTWFQHVLRELGFTLRALAGRVLIGLPEGTIPPRTHMCLAVEAGGETYLVDAGFGGMGLRQPIPLQAGGVLEAGPDRHMLVEGEQGLTLVADFGERRVPLYVLGLEPQHPIDFEVAHHYTSTHPDSRFKQNLLLMRATPTGRVQLRNRSFSLRDGARAEERTLASRSELREVARTHFALDMPDAETLEIPGWIT